MSRSLNQVQLIGNVGKDPETHSISGGNKVVKLSLATSRTFNDRNGQKQEKTDWHRLSVFGKLADVVEQYVQKGDRLFVQGRIEYSQTEDDKGSVRYWTDIVAHELVMLGTSGERQPAATTKAPARSPFDSDDDDLPFG